MYPIRFENKLPKIVTAQDSQVIEVTINALPVVTQETKTVVLEGTLSIDGFDVDWSARCDRCYDREETPWLPCEWDTPSLHVGSFDSAGARDLPVASRAKALGALMFLIDYVYQERVTGK